MFELLPVIERMIALYEMPIGQDRFQRYLQILEGQTKGDMSFPIGAFNPMAKGHVLEQLKVAQQLGFEQAMTQSLNELALPLSVDSANSQFKVALNLVDDLKGGWTNSYTSDYDLRFKLKPYINRNFCIVALFTSEHHTVNLIKTRTRQSVYRTLYQLKQGQPVNLYQHVAQENYVNEQSKRPIEQNQQFLSTYGNSENYHVIFNYFYGDRASESLGFPCYGASGIN